MFFRFGLLCTRRYANWVPTKRSKLSLGDKVKVEEKIFSLESSKPIIGGRGEVLSGKELGSDLNPLKGGGKIQIPTRLGGNFMDCIFKVFRK